MWNHGPEHIVAKGQVQRIFIKIKPNQPQIFCWRYSIAMSTLLCRSPQDVTKHSCSWKLSTKDYKSLRRLNVPCNQLHFTLNDRYNKDWYVPCRRGTWRYAQGWGQEGTSIHQIWPFLPSYHFSTFPSSPARFSSSSPCCSRSTSCTSLWWPSQRFSHHHHQTNIK